MAFDPDVAADIALGLPALKKGEGLEFYVIPAKDANDAPWLLIDKSSRLRPRFTAALKKARALQTFAISKVVSGRIELVRKRIVFVTAEDPPLPLAERMRGKWAAQYAGEDDLKALAAMLRKSAAMLESEVAAGGLARLPDDEPPPQDDAAIDAVFGPQAPELKRRVESLAGGSAALARIPRPPPPPALASAPKLLEGVADAVKSGGIAPKLASLVPEFLKLAQGELPQSAAAVQPGAAVPKRDQMLAVAALAGPYEQTLRAWEERQRQAFELQAEIDRLQAVTERDEDQQFALELYLDQYREAVREARLAEERSEAQLATLEQAAQGLAG